jgi:NADH-quinone oxidoreductase subunit C
VTEKADPEQNPTVLQLRAWNAQAILEVCEFRGEITVVIGREHLHGAAEALQKDKKLQFSHLSDLTCVDRFPMEPRFELNYHFVSLVRRQKARVRVRVPGNDAVVRSLVDLWPGINWHERETFDLFGVRFEGHPDLRRILMPVDWEGYPLRKDFPVEGPR